MSKTKYGKYFLTEPALKNYYVNPKNASPNSLVESGPHFNAGNFTIEWECILEPDVMDPVPHYHDFDGYIGFMGSNIRNIFDFDPEIEVYVSEEGEKHIIDKSTVFYVPKRLVHRPIIFKRIGKPVFFNVAAFRPDYFTSLGRYRTYIIHKGERDKTIEEMKEFIRQNYSPAYAENLKAFLNELEGKKDISKLIHGINLQLKAIPLVTLLV